MPLPQAAVNAPAVCDDLPAVSGGQNSTMLGDDAVATSLVGLDRRKVAVQMKIRGRERVVVGVGNYDVDPELGGVLRVQTSKRRDSPELMFLEDLWTGTIRRGHSLGCDFLIRLS